MTKIIRGPVVRTAGAYDTMFVETIGIGLPAQAIYQQQRAILEVIVQNDPTSANNVSIGNRARQLFVLRPGENITIPINNLNRVYARSVGGATVNFIAMT